MIKFAYEDLLNDPTFVARNEEDLYVELPLYMWSVSAGRPVPVEDTIERTQRVFHDLVPHPTSTYLLRVRGDSMENAMIFDGDLIIVDYHVQPRHNHIVIASLNGEMTVKRLYHLNGRTMLMPENTKYKPITISEHDELIVHGVVTGCYRPLV